MEIFLETERLLLRRFTAGDVDDLVELDGDPEVMKFINGGRPTPREEIENDHLPAFLGYYERFTGFGFWAAEEKSTGQFVGWFHFRPPPDAPAEGVELGYRLRTSAWGKGYATEGSRALIAKGFAELGVERVFATTMVVNVASRRVMEKAGLKYVRTFHQPWPDYIEGQEEGDVEYALLRSDWLAPTQVEIRRLEGAEVRAHLDGLAAVLHDCVAGGASVSFMAPFSHGDARAVFEDYAAEVAQGRRVLLAAFAGDTLVGTVQVLLATPPNQPHRAEIAKMLVHRSARRRGIADLLMERAEAEARAEGRTLLVLDTVTGDAAERLYERRGWTRVGVIPGYALYPDGRPCDTTVFFKSL